MGEFNDYMTPVSNESVVQQVINKLTDAILSGELKPGDKLPPEIELMGAMKVSRNSLRSAIQTLRAYGVLEVRRPEGTFVCNGSSPQMLNPMLYSILLRKEDAYQDLMGLRDIIDQGVSRLVIERGLSEEDTEILEQRYRDIVELIHREPYDAQAIADADMRFHQAVAEATHNSLAAMLNEFMLNITSASRYRVVVKVDEENDRDYLDRVHRRHLDALERKPGADLGSALEYSQYYWKDSYEW